MEKFQIAIIFFLFIQSGLCQSNQQPTSMRLEDQITIQSHGDQTTLSFACMSRVGNCQFSYTILPQNWRQQQNNLVFPSFNLNSIRSFFVRANISEPTGQSMVRDIVIDFSQGPKFTSTLIQSKIGLESMSQPMLGQSISSKESETAEMRNQFGQTFLQAQGIVPMLPSIAKLDSVIVGSDRYEISSVIQDILSFRQPCSEKSGYLNQTVSRIQQHIDFNQKLLSQEQKNQVMEQDDLQALQEQKNKINEELKLLSDKQKIKEELGRLQTEKQRSYTKYYSYEIIAIRYQDKMQEMTMKQVVDPQDLQLIKESVQIDRLQLRQIEDQLKKLAQKKGVLEKQLRQNEKKILETMNTASANADSVRVKQLQTTYDQYMSLALKYKVQYENSQSQLAILKEKLGMLQSTFQRLNSRLREVEKQLQRKKEAKMSSQMQNAKNRLEVLKRNMPRLEEQLKKCLPDIEDTEAAPPKQDPTNNDQSDEENVQVVPVSENDKKIMPTYKQTHLYDITELRYKNRNSNAVNIFSSKWIMSYGVPRTYSFPCSSGNIISKYGKILQVHSAAIRVEDYFGDTYIIQIGSCTRISGPASSFAPQINDVIDWNGYEKTKGIYNALRINFYAM